ncbi:hypothetical protein Q5P01_013311 [Channa striata]|uniref:Cilia- and flagella-associated protein 65 n=1 Tax=Channa striata TaxID=64152 RepID=A0AA88MKB5_CHASR|nr:hypothetical protein Q5P01_013311 [Channa striata]
MKEAMVPESLALDPLASTAPWVTSRAGPVIKDPGTHHRQLVKDHHLYAQRRCFFGLETMTELVWEDWDQGKAFTKTLVLKNMHSKLQKLHLRPPVSKFFTTLIPQIIVLSPGTSFSVPVTFKPLQRCEYEDTIEFQGKDGSFQVSLRAIIPCLALEVPDSVLLPLCAVQHSSHTTFRVRNLSKLHTCFHWVCAAPFQLSPEQGVLKPSQECHITVVFQPQEALVYQEHAYCRFGEEGDKAESSCTVLLQGLAKYPYLQLRIAGTKEVKQQGTPVLDFGSVAIGQNVQKHFEIFNPSPVTASFSLSRLSPGVPSFGEEFCFDVTRGKLAPGESQQATVAYSPAVVDTVSVEYLSLKGRGALKESLLKLTGTCIGPKVSLSSSLVDFGCVEEAGVVTQTVELVNSSPAEALYQWDLDSNGHSVFSIQPASGTIKPHSHTTLKAFYRPTQPIAHHRRVTCLILHRDPLFLDLIGTCHSELQQPAVLRPEHLVLYKLHWYRRQDPPDAPSEVQLDQQGMQTILKENSNQRQESAAVVPLTPMEELYQSCLGSMDPGCSFLSSSHVSVVPNQLLFNHKMSPSSFTSSACCQFVSITNHTRGKLRVVWTVAQDSPFAVSPSVCELAPLKSTSFTVTYEPKQLNTLHGAQLECFAFYKDSHQIGEQLLCLPWCVTVRVIGHSFQPGKEHFIPCCSLEPSQVVFPALSALSYRTVLVRNSGDLPLTFCLDQSSNPALTESVTVIPNFGLIKPGDHQILTLRTTPTEDSPKQGFSLQLRLNAAKDTKALTVFSVVEKPCVFMEGDKKIYFQPVAVGSHTQHSHQIRNLSRVPLRFQWSIPESSQKIISVEPAAGELHPNETSEQTWSFSPPAEETYTAEPSLTFWPIQTDECNMSQLTLKVEGMGSSGFIKAEKAVVDVGEILVGSNRSIEIPLVNNSPCAMSICLSVQQRLLEEELNYDPQTETSALHLDCERRTIPSQCTMLLRSTFRPERRAQYSWTISYQALNSSGLVSSTPRAVCEVRAKGVFPTLQVTDVSSSGSADRFSKHHLWKLFSLDSLNAHLLSSPSSFEFTYRICTRHSFHSDSSVFTKAILDFNFSAAPVNSDPSVFMLMFYNPGSIAVDWAFLFPEDQQMEMDYWTEAQEFSSTELHQMKVQENQLFNISPRSGTLPPRQQRAVHLSYSHKSVGTNRFPVVFKLSYGREVLLNLQGVTVDGDRPCLYFASNKHVFTAVTIGDCSPPRQVYELHNAGAVPVHYEVDTTVLSQLQVDNFNHPVLCCINPQGEVLPGQLAILEWIFSPLEAKTYQMDIPIHVQDGDSTLVTFEGCGYYYNSTVGPSNPFTCRDTETSVPCGQRGPFPGQLVFLCDDSISFGDIPVSSRCSRILFLINVSHTDTFHYNWDLSQQGNPQVVQIHPEQGSICPGESVLCVLTFTSTDYPTVYLMDFICQVTQEAAMVRYHDALQQWEEERQRQQDEFTITDKNLTVNEEALAAPPVRKGLLLMKYKTLPPICVSSSSKTVGNKPTKSEHRTLQETKVWEQPEPPKPALLHLGVTAHSHGLLEYGKQFPDRFNKIYRCLLTDKNHKAETSNTSHLTGPSQPSPEKDIVMHILISLLNNILDDSVFVQSLITLGSKPIFYRPTEISPILQPSSSPSEIDPQVFSGTKAGLNKNDNTVDREDSAGSLENKSQTQKTLHPEYVPAYMAEDVLLNTLQNLMMEAVRGELVLTAYPRAVILPPVSARMSRTTAEEETGDTKSKNTTSGTQVGMPPSTLS